MKKLALFAMLAACDLQPAPPPPPPPPPAAAPAAPAPAVATGSGSAGSAAPAPASRPPAPPVEVSPECEQAGIKLAELMINGAEDSQKPAFERDRTNIIRRTEVACTQQHWVPAALACMNQSRSDQDARACLEKFPAPGVKAAEGSAAPPPAGSGSPKGPR